MYSARVSRGRGKCKTKKKKVRQTGDTNILVYEIGIQRLRGKIVESEILAFFTEPFLASVFGMGCSDVTIEGSISKASQVPESTIWKN